VKSKRIISVLCAVSTACAIAACGGSNDKWEPTDTKDQAVQRVEELLQEAFAALPPGATLELRLDAGEDHCDTPVLADDPSRVRTQKSYSVVAPRTGAWPDEQVIPTLVAFWQKKGYATDGDWRQEVRFPIYSVETADKYGIAVNGWDRGDHLDYTIEAGSPCIWENGTPDRQ
jgi:hypothetical protein